MPDDQCEFSGEGLVGQNAATVAGLRQQLDRHVTVKSALTSDYQLMWSDVIH